MCSASSSGNATTGSNRLRHRSVILLKRAFDYAIVWGLISVNPVHATPMRFITRARPRTRALSPEEVRTYLEVLYRSNIRRQFKLALNLILLTLVRKSELLHALWRQVDFKLGEWALPGESVKNEKPHIVYLSRQATDILTELKALAGDSEFVLAGRGSLNKPFASNALNKALEGVNFPIPPFTIHDLRRTGSTILHERGFSSDVVEKALNHTIGGVRGARVVSGTPGCRNRSWPRRHRSLQRPQAHGCFCHGNEPAVFRNKGSTE